MTNSKFKSGDVVILKSGGPRMTVKEVNENSIKCIWFNEKHIQQGGLFEESTIESDDYEENN
jgi:uncharacterized protein YodC (DUF2158 family)